MKGALGGSERIGNIIEVIPGDIALSRSKGLCIFPRRVRGAFSLGADTITHFRGRGPGRVGRIFRRL